MTVSFDVSLGSSPSPSELPPYQLTIAAFPDDTFHVFAFKGREVISSAYSFEIIATAHTDGSDEIERVSLGQKATLLWNFGKTQRAFYGVIAAVRLAEASEASGTVRYHLRFVPRLWLLKRKRRSRIFQNQGVTDIVTSVLLEAGISARWQLTRSYPIREYCTQYEESDYHFVTRLLAEAGIYFYFPQGPALDAATLAAAMAVTAVGDVADAAASALGAPALGAVVGAVASDVAPIIPGDTLIGGDDAAFYPPIGKDDPAELLAASAAALVPEVGAAVGDALGVGGGGGLGDVGGAALGAASAIAGSAIAALTEKSAPVLHYLEMQQTTMSHLDKITRFTLRDSVRSNQAAFRDYDPQRPLVPLTSAAVSSAPFPPSPLELAAEAAAAATTALSAAGSLVPGGAGAALGSIAGGISAVASVVEEVAGDVSGQPMLETYDHHGDFLFPKWAFAADEAPRILRQKRRRASIAEGESGCPDLSPGHRFALADHPVDHLDQPYVVTAVEHRGAVNDASQKLYWNDLECAPATVTYVPPRPRRKSVQVALTATVVGPGGEEIHVDAMGQIKVQFHWDREGRYDDHSSCWIRTMHAWGGAGWGAQFIPRVGMEVVVVFDGGDPDRPMVLGSVYNGTHPSPFILPADKTRSGWRTQSSPVSSAGGGFNELSFEDAASREQIYVHAQRNLDEVVEKNHTLLVRNDELLRILGNRMDTIEKNLEELVRGDHSSQVEGNRIDVVTGNSDGRVSGMLVTRVEGKERRLVQGTTDLEYADDLTLRARGCVTTVVGTPDKKRSWVTHAEGTLELTGADAAHLASDKELTLRVGKSAVRITADGIELSAGSISVKGGGGGVSASSDGLALSSKGDAQVVVGKKLVLKSGGASLSMDQEVKADGSQILLNSPAQANDALPKDPKPPTKVELVDDQGAPLAHQRFLIKLDDGTEVSGMTDKDGKAELDLKSGGKVTFPDLKDAKAG